MAGISYGLNPLFGKPLLDGGVPVLSMLFFRYAISALLLGGWMLLRKETFKATWKEFRLLIVLGILFAASSVTLFESYKFIPAGLATTLVYLYPIFVAVIMLLSHLAGVAEHCRHRGWGSGAQLAGWWRDAALGWDGVGCPVGPQLFLLLNHRQPFATHQAHFRARFDLLCFGGRCNLVPRIPNHRRYADPSRY